MNKPAVVRLLLVTSLLTLSPGRILAQGYRWEVIAHPDTTGYGLQSVAFIDTLHGWTAWGTIGHMYQTADGGFNWQPPPTPSDFGFLVYQMVLRDTLTLWCFGNNGGIGRILMTSDGGRSWVQKHDVYGELIRGGAVLSDSVLLASGIWQSPQTGVLTAMITRSTDGGRTWQRTLFPDSLHNVYFGRMQALDSVTAFTSHLPSQTLLRTTDAGSTWQALPVPEAGSAIYFFDRERAILHRPPQFMRTWDAGSHWLVTADLRDSIGNPPRDDFGTEIFSFPDSVSGWAFGSLFYRGGVSEGIYHTSDGGYSWQKESEGLSPGPLQDGLMIGRTHGWAVGFYGDVLAYRPTANGIRTEPSSRTTGYTLSQNYPNPFNGQTRISYTLPTKTRVRLEVFDLLGRLVLTLVDGEQEPGVHEAVFTANSIASGMYIARLITSSGHTLTKGMMLIR